MKRVYSAFIWESDVKQFPKIWHFSKQQTSIYYFVQVIVDYMQVQDY